MTTNENHAFVSDNTSSQSSSSSPVVFWNKARFLYSLIVVGAICSVLNVSTTNDIIFPKLQMTIGDIYTLVDAPHTSLLPFVGNDSATDIEKNDGGDGGVPQEEIKTTTAQLNQTLRIPESSSNPLLLTPPPPPPPPVQTASAAKTNNNEDDDGTSKEEVEYIVSTNTTIKTNVLLDGFPITRFTSLVTKLVENIPVASEQQSASKCPTYFSLIVDQPYTKPRIDPNNYRRGEYWHETINRMFYNNSNTNNDIDHNWVLPGNVTIGFSMQDADMPGHPKQNWACLLNSSPNGNHSFINFLEAKRLAKRRSFLPKAIIPWEERDKIPIFRGTSHGKMKGLVQVAESEASKGNDNSTTAILNNQTQQKIIQFILKKCLRCRAVYLSKQYPELLNARFHKPLGELWDKKKYKKQLVENATNGISTFLPFDSIKEEVYYTQYQTALVLCGIGAAYRTAIHLETTTAIILDDCQHQEWFTKLMIPWKHYIPVDKELNDLKEKLVWVQQNPKQVYEIAQNGYQFYLDYLSFDRDEEHLYELLYRLSLKTNGLTARKLIKPE